MKPYLKRISILIISMTNTKCSVCKTSKDIIYFGFKRNNILYKTCIKCRTRHTKQMNEQLNIIEMNEQLNIIEINEPLNIEMHEINESLNNEINEINESLNNEINEINEINKIHEIYNTPYIELPTKQMVEYTRIDQILNKYGYIIIPFINDVFTCLNNGGQHVIELFINNKLAMDIPNIKKVVMPLSSSKLSIIDTTKFLAFETYINTDIYNKKTICEICFEKRTYNFKTCSRCNNPICNYCFTELNKQQKKYSCSYCRYTLEEHLKNNHIENININ
jgi:hypothetical protein